MGSILQFVVSNEKMILYVLIGLMALLVGLIFWIDYKSKSKKESLLDKELLEKEMARKEALVNEETPIVENGLEEPSKVEVMASIADDTNKVAEWVDVNTGNIPIIKEKIVPVSEIKYVEKDEQEMAQEELKKITEELEKEQEAKNAIVDNLVETATEQLMKDQTEELLEVSPVGPIASATLEEPVKVAAVEDKNHSLSSFEEEQEASAIISLNELFEKAHTLYENDMLEDYREDDVPINLSELEAKFKPADISKEVVFEKAQAVVEPVNVMPPAINEPIRPFTASPIISPIYGITKDRVEQDSIELENTANYDKLDQEIKKTNAFLDTLKELKEKLEN